MNEIILRDVCIEDADMVYLWKQDEYLQYMALDENYSTTLSHQQDDIEQAIKSEGQEYKIILLNKEPIGYIRINYIDDLMQMAWLRFALGKERRKGYMEKALRLYFSDLFSKKVIRVEGEVYEYNLPSQQLLERLGFVKEGVKRKAHYLNGTYYDIYAYGLLKEEYNE